MRTAKARKAEKAGPAGISEADRRFMAEAIALSRKGMRRGDGGPFGALIVCRGEILSRGWNRVLVSADPTAHAEITAIRAACRRLGAFSLEGCDLFTSCEPCPMCLGAAYWARVDRLIYANTRKDAAAIGFSDDFIYTELDRSPSRRRLPMIQLMRDEAFLPFAEWRAKADKTHY